MPVRRIALAVASMSLGLACSSAEPYEPGYDEPVFDEDDIEDDLGKADSLQNRWEVPNDIAEETEDTSVPPDGAPPWDGGVHCSGAMTPGARELSEFLSGKFAAISSIGGYACRPNTANTSKQSVHGTGRALDIFIPTLPTGGADNAAGDPVANWLVLNADRIGIQYVIWDRTSWSGSRTGEKTRAYGGPHPHHDHLHVEINEQAARRETAWFTDGGDFGPGIGTTCDSDAVCAFDGGGQSGHCEGWFDASVKEIFGYCSLPCFGECPGSPGTSGTFCARGRDGAGHCVAVAGAANDSCADIPGTEPRVVSRYAAGPGPRDDIATVCMPPDAQAVACEGSVGECIDTDHAACSGEIAVGLCPGGNNIRCCLARPYQLDQADGRSHLHRALQR